MGKRITLLSKLKKGVRTAKQVDMFGKYVGFYVDGESTYTTWIGALVSVVVIGLTLIFSSTKYLALRDKTNTSFSTFSKVGEQAPDFSFGQDDGF